MESPSRLLLAMIAIEIIGILVIVAGILEFLPEQDIISSPVLINIGAVLVALGGLGVAKFYDGETLLGSRSAGSSSGSSTAGTVAEREPGRETEDTQDETQERSHVPVSGEGVYRREGDLVVRAAVDQVLNEQGKTAASDLYDALDEEVEELLEDARENAKETDRKTVEPRDL